MVTFDPDRLRERQVEFEAEGGDDGQGVQDFHGFRSKMAFRALVAPKAEAVQRLGKDVSFEFFG